jgi:transposase
MKNSDFRALSSEAQEVLRRKAVNAVLDGMSQAKAAETFGVTRQAMCGWMKKYEEGGQKALKALQRGRPKGQGRLEPWQAAQTVKAITDQSPDQLKLPFWLWTREAVGDFIEKRFGVSVSIWTVGRMLKRWGFTPQKPIRRALEQDPIEVRKWMNETYPRIRAMAKRESAEIYWGDEMGMRSDHTTGTTYGRKGQTPVIPGTGKRFGCNMVSAITNRGEMSFMVFKHRFNANVFLVFLRRLVRQVGRKFFLIIDRHPAHVAKKVQNWISAHKDDLQIFFLPGYSPRLNPDELLNQDVKSNAVGRRRAATQSELLSHVRSYLRSTQRLPEIVRSYFRHKDVQYAAAS